MGELTPVYEIDGRVIGDRDGGARGPVTKQIQDAFRLRTAEQGWVVPQF